MCKVTILYSIRCSAEERCNAKMANENNSATGKSDYVNLCMAYINVTMIYLKGNLKFEGIACSF